MVKSASMSPSSIMVVFQIDWHSSQGERSGFVRSKVTGKLLIGVGGAVSIHMHLVPRSSQLLYYRSVSQDGAWRGHLLF